MRDLAFRTVAGVTPSSSAIVVAFFPSTAMRQNICQVLSSNSQRTCRTASVSNASRLGAGYCRAVIWLSCAVFLLDGDEIIASYDQIGQGLTVAHNDTLQGFATSPFSDSRNSAVRNCHNTFD
jgi:hypothetical protein